MINLLSALRRVAVIAVIGAMLVIVPHAVQGSHTAGFTYTIDQGNGEQTVIPLVGVADVATFYSYSEASAHTGLEQSDTSILYLYEDSSGNISLVMTHDVPSDGSGGTVTFALSGIPSGTEFVVTDDPTSAHNDGPYTVTSGAANLTWRWDQCCTDGGALSRGLAGQEFTLAIVPTFTSTSGIGQWQFLTGDLANPTRTSLDMSKPITIRARRTIPVTIDIKPGGEPNCLNNNGHGVIPVAILSSATFDATQVDPTTVALNGQGVRVVGKGNLQANVEDVNGDGFLDLVVQIEDQDGAYEEGDTMATLTGSTYSGNPIEGTDSICIVP